MTRTTGRESGSESGPGEDLDPQSGSDLNSNKDIFMILVFICFLNPLQGSTHRCKYINGSFKSP